jgi:hypothetical protein
MIFISRKVEAVGKADHGPPRGMFALLITAPASTGLLIYTALGSARDAGPLAVKRRRAAEAPDDVRRPRRSADKAWRLLGGDDASPVNISTRPHSSGRLSSAREKQAT